MSKTHWKSLTDSDYIGAYTLDEGKDLIVTIESVSKDKVTGEGGSVEERIVAQLKGQKPWVINATNSKTISKVVGSPYIEDWVNKSVTLFVSMAKFRGEEVECLRVRDFAPKVDIDTKSAIKKLKAAKTLAGLQKAYTSLSREEQGADDVVAVKDELKTKLQ